jgi:predicted protein tyrosine phosphatase
MIIVSSLREAQNQISIHGARHAISLLSPDTAHRRFDGVDHDKHLQLTFHDIVMITDGLSAPQALHVQTLISFLRRWEKQAPLLIHCWAGVSRSTASAYIAKCMYEPEGAEEDIAWELREASASATPNPRMIAMADEVLGRNGRMINAIAKIGRGEDAFEGTPFVLKLKE